MLVFKGSLKLEINSFRGQTKEVTEVWWILFTGDICSQVGV